jgi:hypothetical protein
MLSDIKDEDKLVFFPWPRYVKLTPDRQQTILNEQHAWSYNYKSVVVGRFQQNNNNVHMRKTNSTVSDYLHNMLHPITKEKMFEFVYPTRMGKREFIVSNENYGDAEDLLRVIKGELARQMSFGAIQQEFDKEINIDKEMKRQTWTPFTRAANIIPSVLYEHNTNVNNNKRLRTNEKEHQQQHYPYHLHHNIVSPKAQTKSGQYTYSQATTGDTLVSTLTSPNTSHNAA